MLINKRSFSKKKEKDEIKNETKLMQQKISFIIGSSLPGENSIDQWNYLIQKQMLCEGYSEEKARMNIQMFRLLRCTENKDQFDEALNYFSTNPMIIKSVGYDSTFAEQAKTWWPRKTVLKKL